MNYLKKWLEQKFNVPLEENEKIVLVVRKHWISLLMPGIKVFLAIFIPGIFLDYIFKHVALLILFLIWFSFILGYAIYHSVRWYYDSFIITDKRIIDIDQKGVFNRTVSETTFARVQDATYEVKGFLSTLLDYGTVKVQTAGSDETIELNYVPNPKQVQDRIVKIGGEPEEKEDKETKEVERELSAKELIEFIQQAKSQKAEKGKSQQKPSRDLQERK